MIGEELRKAREQVKLTQEGLAFASGLHRTYISILEGNLKSPTLDALTRISKVLKVPVSVLVRRAEKAARIGRRKRKHI